jgi:hypothetical protein
MSMQELFEKKEYCIKELHSAREIFCSGDVTFEQKERLQKALTFMYLYCPEEIRDLVLSHIEEIEIRWDLMHGRL